MLKYGNQMVPIYQYDPELFFLTRVKNAQIHNGHLLKPEASTLIPPPKCNDENLIPVFNETENSWVLKKALNLGLKKRKITDCWVDYDYSGCFPHQLIPYIYKIDRPDYLGDQSVIKVINRFSSFKKLRSYLNPLSAQLFVVQRIVYLNTQIASLYQQYDQRGVFGYLQKFQSFYFQEVDIVHNIKKLIDTLVVALYLEKNIIPEENLACDGLSYLLNNTIVSETKQQVKEEIDFGYYEDFLLVINELHNGYKHDILTEKLFDCSDPEPCLHLNKFKKKKKNKCRFKDPLHVTCYAIDLRKLIYACNDFLTFLIDGYRHTGISRFQKVERDRFDWIK